MRKLFYESIMDLSVGLLTIMGQTKLFGFLVFFGATRINPSKISLIWCRMTQENFVRIVWRVFAKIEKNSKKCGFLTSQWYDFDAFAHTGAPLGVKWLFKILRKSYGFWEFEIFIEWSGKKTTRFHNFFRLLIIPTKSDAFSAKWIQFDSQFQPIRLQHKHKLDVYYIMSVWRSH